VEKQADGNRRAEKNPKNMVKIRNMVEQNIKKPIKKLENYKNK
jgi:hypothetical protein